MCIHGQKAISRKSEPNLSEGRRGGEHKKFCSFTHMCCRPAVVPPPSEEFECHPPVDLMEDIGAPQRVEHSFGSSPHWHQREARRRWRMRRQ